MSLVRLVASSLTLSAFLGLSVGPSSAQDVQWELVASGVIETAEQGTGIEMRVRATPVPEELLAGPDMPLLLAAICDHYGPDVLRFVRDQSGLETPTFIAVRVLTGDRLDASVFQAFEVDGSGCGEPL